MLDFSLLLLVVNALALVVVFAMAVRIFQASVQYRRNVGDQKVQWPYALRILRLIVVMIVIGLTVAVLNLLAS